MSSKVKIAAVLLVVCVVVACNLPFASPTITNAPVGEYDCYGMEAGAYAYTGLLKIDADGTVEFKGRTGSWTYDSEREEFAFTGDVLLARATYEAEHDSLDVELRPGVSISHAETGVMMCDARD